MRLVGRPGLRLGLLPQPPAVEVPLDAAGARWLSRLLRRDGSHLPCRRELGASGGAGTARLASAARPVARTRGRQEPGGVPDGGSGQGPRAARGACPARRSDRPALRGARRLEGGTGMMTPTTIGLVRGRRVWDSRGRPTVEAEV